MPSTIMIQPTGNERKRAETQCSKSTKGTRNEINENLDIPTKRASANYGHPLCCYRRNV